VLGDPSEWVTMTFDPEVQVNVRPIIEHLAGRRTIILTADEWEDMKEQIADMLEQFVALRAS
jgi:hypothetical protein